MIRCVPIILALIGCASAAEPTFLLWDNHESVADYAKKVNLAPTMTLDLGNGIMMELILIPAGKFIMGTPEPTPVDEAGFQKQIGIGQLGLAASSVTLLIMLTVVAVRAVRSRRRPQLSLALLLLITVAAGGCVLGGMSWRQSVQTLEAAKVNYTAAQARFHDANQDEKPAHLVTLTKPFYMGKFPVTQGQYKQVMLANPSQFKDNSANPVDNVSWDDAKNFCKKLSEHSDQAVSLPTEAEWEYGCRAGTTTAYHSGDTFEDLERVAWYYVNSKNIMHPCGQKAPNAFGLYDMHGNVFQLCQDYYGDDYYSKSPSKDPEGPNQSAYRVMRGGAWNFAPESCRSSHRGGNPPDTATYVVGFRVVVSASSPPKSSVSVQPTGQ